MHEKRTGKIKPGPADEHLFWSVLGEILRRNKNGTEYLGKESGRFHKTLDNNHRSIDKLYFLTKRSMTGTTAAGRVTAIRTLSV